MREDGREGGREAGREGGRQVGIWFAHEARLGGGATPDAGPAELQLRQDDRLPANLALAHLAVGEVGVTLRR